MSPRGLPTLSMIASQASMHCVQWMHSICRPSRMSMPVGQVSTQAPQSMQSPASAGRSFTFVPRGSPRARVVADDQRLPVEQHRLQAPVRAGDEAGLLAELGEVEEDQRRRRRP